MTGTTTSAVHILKSTNGELTHSYCSRIARIRIFKRVWGSCRGAEGPTQRVTTGQQPPFLNTYNQILPTPDLRLPLI
jgi:hypothetical protein